jgi:hypothetical protein
MCCRAILFLLCLIPLTGCATSQSTAQTDEELKNDPAFSPQAEVADHGVSPEMKSNIVLAPIALANMALGNSTPDPTNAQRVSSKSTPTVAAQN